MAAHMGIGTTKKTRTGNLGVRIASNPPKPNIAPEAPTAKTSGLPKILIPRSVIPKK